MATRRVTFEGAYGDRLSARVDLPVEGTPRAWALFAHCFTCSMNLKAVVNIARALNLEGIGVMRFDFTGLGESEGEFADTNFSSNIADLLAAARYMEEEWGPPEILIGHSLGGAAVLHAGGQVESCRAVVTIGAPAQPSHVLQHLEGSFEEIEEAGVATVKLAGRPFKVRQQFVDDLRAARMEDAVKDLGCALLILHSPTDDIVSIENAGRIFTMARHPRSFVSLDGADHLLSREEDSVYAARVMAGWASRYVDLKARDAEEDAPEADSGHSEGAMASDPPVDGGAPGGERPQDQVVVRTGPEGFQTEIWARGHHLLADEPESVGGTDRGPGPYEILCGALGACTSMTLRMYADRKGWPLEEVHVRLRHEKDHAEDERRVTGEDGEDGIDPRLDYIRREIRCEGPLTDGQRARLVEIASRCPVHRTLEAGVRVGTVRRDPADASDEGDASA